MTLNPHSQGDVVENPDVADGFLGLRGSFDHFRQLTATTARLALKTSTDQDRAREVPRARPLRTPRAPRPSAPPGS